MTFFERKQWHRPLPCRPALKSQSRGGMGTSIMGVLEALREHAHAYATTGAGLDTRCFHPSGASGSRAYSSCDLDLDRGVADRSQDVGSKHGLKWAADICLHYDHRR